MQVIVNVPDNIPQKELKYKIEEFEASLADELREEEVGMLKEVLDKLRSKGTFEKIKDPVQWQKEQRRERALPYRQ